MIIAYIRPPMDVLDPSGRRCGCADLVEGRMLRLAEGGRHRYMPLDGVERIDRQIHLEEPCGDAKRDEADSP